MGQMATPANERRYSNEPKAVMLEQLGWFAKQVMPKFTAGGR